MIKLTMIKALSVLFLFVLGGCTLITDFDESSDSLYSIRDNISSEAIVTLDSANRGTLELTFATKLPESVTDDKFLAMLKDGTILVQVQNAEGVSLNLLQMVGSGQRSLQMQASITWNSTMPAKL